MADGNPGCHGARIADFWAKDGPRAYIGSMLSGFPNFFMAYGPNTNSFGGLHIIELLEIEIGFAQQCIVSLIEYDRCAVNISTHAYGRSCMNGPIDYRRMCITCATRQAGCPKRMMPT